MTESVKILPRARHARHLRLAAELAVGADFARHARDFRGEHAELLDHGVDDVGGAQELAFERAAVHVEPDGLRQIALRHGRDGAGDFRGGPQQVVDQRIDRDFHLAPGAFRLVETGALARSSFLAHDLPNALQLLRHLLIGGDDVIEGVGNLSRQPGPGARQAHGKVAVPHGLQARQDDGQIRRLGLGSQAGVSVVL